MKNAIVVSIAKQRWAIELGWVREVITLGQVTRVPTSPSAIYGVINFGGALVPVIDVLGLSQTTRPKTENRSAGEAASKMSLPRIAILLQVKSVRVALRVDAVVEVTTLRDLESKWVDAAGVSAQLLDPPHLVGVIRMSIDSGIDQQRPNRSESRER